jgi:hypothetical protein
MFQPPRVSPPGITHTRRGLSHTNSVDNFGDVLKDMGRYEEALVHMQKALDIQIKLLGSEKDLVALSYLNICELRRCCCYGPCNLCSLQCSYGESRR